MLAAVDKWRRRQPEPPTRATAIRWLATTALQILAKAPGEKPARKAGTRAPTPRVGADVVGKMITAAGLGTSKRSSQMAGEAIDHLGDKSAPVEEQERRKRRLLKGPVEFREMRGRHPKPKG